MLARLGALDGEHRVVVQAVVERDVEARRLLLNHARSFSWLAALVTVR